MKRAPNTGSISKLSGRRRKPWLVQITTGHEVDYEKKTVKQVRKTLGTYATKREAQEAIEAFNTHPFNLDGKSTTFADIYALWSAEHFSEIVPSACRTWISAYNHCSALHDIPIRQIKAYDLEQCIMNASVGDSTKARMKSLFNQMWRYAMKHDLVDKDYASLCNTVKQAKKEAIHKSFTDEQISLLWQNTSLKWVNMILIGIYTGLRPQELATLPPESIHDGYMIAGSKTDAGMDRLIPIHSVINVLVDDQKEQAQNMESKTLFFDTESQTGKHMTYDKYRKRFDKVMAHFGWDNRPHDTRHTFITLAKRYGMVDGALKNIIGHQTGDLTEDVYTHRTLEDLQMEIEKIKT